MPSNPPSTVEWGQPLDPDIAALIRAAMVLREGPPDIAAPIDLGSRDYADADIYAFAGELLRRAGGYARTIVCVLAMERMLAGDDPNVDFWFRVMGAMVAIDRVETEPGGSLH